MVKKPSEWRGVGTERFRVTLFSRLGRGDDDETQYPEGRSEGRALSTGARNGKA